MMDKEEYKREIVRMWDTLRDDKYKGIESCSGVNDCGGCPLNNIKRGESFNAFEMIEAVEKWAKENPPKKYKISRLEYDILKHLSDNTEHMYITRDLNGFLCLFDKKPEKNVDYWKGFGLSDMNVFDELFQFVQWEDIEPTSIQDVLEKCEVEDDR